MKNKKMVSIVVVVVLVLALIPIKTSNAKTKAKLSEKNITMTVGDTKVIKLVNSKKGAIWSTENQNIEIISETKKKVKIKAVEEGKSKVYALVGKKEYKCNIFINDKSGNKNEDEPEPTIKPKKEKLSKRTYITKDKFVVEYTNKGSSTVHIKPSATFYDENGKKVAAMLPDNGNLIIAPSQTAYSLYEISSEEYISAETSVKFEDLYDIVAHTNCLKIETIDRRDKVDCVIKNISNVTMSADIVAVFKDRTGNIVYATTVDNEEDSMSEFYLKSGESSISSFYKPYDIPYYNYNIVYYAYN